MKKLLGLASMALLSVAASATTLVDSAALDDVKTDVTTVGTTLVTIALVALGAGIVYRVIMKKS